MFCFFCYLFYNILMIEICFVCTGNTCRSIMAERIAKKMAKNKKIKDVKFSSAGLRADGSQITENARTVLKKLGYDGRKRKSVLLSDVKPNVIYVTVTDDHKKFVKSKKVISFNDLAGEVLDPYLQDLQVYEKTAKQIEKNVELLLNKIENLRGEV